MGKPLPLGWRDGEWDYRCAALSTLPPRIIALLGCEYGWRASYNGYYKLNATVQTVILHACKETYPVVCGFSPSVRIELKQAQSVGLWALPDQIRFAAHDKFPERHVADIIHTVATRSLARWKWLYQAFICAGGPTGTTFSDQWRTDTAVSLAQHIVTARDFSAMPILADALQDADCDHEELLSHLRTDRGLWLSSDWVLWSLLRLDIPPEQFTESTKTKQRRGKGCSRKKT